MKCSKVLRCDTSSGFGSLIIIEVEKQLLEFSCTYFYFWYKLSRIRMEAHVVQIIWSFIADTDSAPL